MDDLKPVNPGQTHNIADASRLVQVQHKQDRVEVVTHLDKGPKPFDVHVVSTIDRNGKGDTTIDRLGQEPHERWDVRPSSCRVLSGVAPDCEQR